MKYFLKLDAVGFNIQVHNKLVMSMVFMYLKYINKINILY